jgi:hypothetical protein
MSVSVAAGTCLQTRCLEMALVYLLISWSLLSNGSTRYNILTGLCVYNPTEYDDFLMLSIYVLLAGV